MSSSSGFRCAAGFRHYRSGSGAELGAAIDPERRPGITATGKLIEIPVAEILGVREAKVFKSSVRGGRSHLIVQLRSGEVAFYVLSNADWINAITSLRK